MHPDKCGFLALSVCICVHLWFHFSVWLDSSLSPGFGNIPDRQNQVAANSRTVVVA